MGIPILVRWHFYIESVPQHLQRQCRHGANTRVKKLSIMASNYVDIIIYICSTQESILSPFKCHWEQLVTGLDRYIVFRHARYVYITLLILWYGKVIMLIAVKVTTTIVSRNETIFMMTLVFQIKYSIAPQYYQLINIKPQRIASQKQTCLTVMIVNNVVHSTNTLAIKLPCDQLRDICTFYANLCIYRWISARKT